MNNKKKQLGIPFGTASHQLRKLIMFDLVKKLGLNFCYRCGVEIETVTEFSLDHKEDWLNSNNPSQKFFDVENIAFSHLKCNCDASKKHKTGVKHPSHRAYNEGCRCDECRSIEAERRRKQRNKAQNELEMNSK